MEILLGLGGIVITVLIALIPYFKRRYGDRPKLEIEIQYRSGSSSPRGISPKTDTSKGYIEADEAIRVFELEWRLAFIIRNNSDVATYYPKWHYLKDSIQVTALEKLPNKPILNSADISLTGKFRKFEESLGQQRTQTNGIPADFNRLKIVLEYQNSHETKFYSLYEHADKEKPNKHLNKRPKDLKD